MKTKKTFLMLIILSMIVSFQLHAQTPGFEWAVQTGGDSLIWPQSLATDNLGNQITVGYFRGTLDLCTGTSDPFSISSNGSDDVFIQKTDPNGNLLWAYSMGDTKNDAARCVVTDDAGNIYVTGSFYNSIDVDFSVDGEYWLTRTDRWASFVLKLNPDGEYLWAKQMGSPDDWGNAYAYAITLDNAGNVITSGTFAGRVDFDPGAGIFNLSSTSASDAFIHKLDPSGNFIWAKQLAGTEYKNPYSLAADATGVYITGYFKGTVDFNPDKKLKYNMTSYGDYDAFIMKLDPSGTFSWAGQVGGTSQDIAYAMVMGSDGTLYCTGYFNGTADFNPKSGVTSLTSFGMSDSFIFKVDQSGNLIWANQYGGNSYEGSHDICKDADDNVYMTGFFWLTSDFDPSPASEFYLTSSGTQDAFICKTTSGGDFVWATHVGNPGWQVGFAVSADQDGNIFSAGGFVDTVDFNPGGNGEAYFANAENTENDLYLFKLNPNIPDNCVVPSGLSASDITINSATLAWNEITGANYYARYRETNASDWTDIAGPLGAPYYALDGLEQLTAYEFQVKTDCESNYSYSFIFTTLGEGCPDSYEPNETMGTAPSIPVNTEIAALIATSMDRDYYKFTTTGAAKNIHVTLTSLPANYSLFLYKSDGTVLGSSLNPELEDESIIYNSNKTGTYYVQVYGSGLAFDPADCYILHVATSGVPYSKAATAEIQSTTDDRAALSIYPNPARDVLNLDFNATVEGNVNIALINISGQVILEKSFSANEGPNHSILSLEGLSDGLYIIKLSRNGENTIRKFMINR